MNRQDVEKLLGGYASGALSEEEERALFAAALEDQQLFDALAREQSLRDLLRDPAARATLLTALDEQPLPWYRRWSKPLVLAAAAALLAIVLPVGIWQARHRRPQPVLTAEMDAPVSPAPETVVNQPQAAPLPPVIEPKLPPAAPHKPQANFKHLPPGRLLPMPKKEPMAVVTVPEPAPSVAIAPPPKDLAVTAGEAKVGMTPQSVEVTAAAAPPAPPRLSDSNGVVAGSLQAPASHASQPKFQPQTMGALRAIAALSSPLTWTVLRRQPDGDFTVANPAELQAGDTVKLRLESKNTGYVYVADGQALLTSSPIEAGKPFETVLEPRGPGEREIEFWFSPRPTVRPAAAARAGAGGGGAVPPAAQPHPPSIRITLQYK